MGLRAFRFRRRGGFTLVEVLIASALVGFSLVVMFGFHAQAARSVLHSRKLTSCTYLAQAQLEQLLSLAWTSSSRPSDLEDLGDDDTSGSDPWVWLEHPSSGDQPSAVNAAANSDTTYGQASYFVTWDVEDMDTDETWLRIRVRCAYEDERFDRYKGTTISSYKFRDS